MGWFQIIKEIVKIDYLRFTDKYCLHRQIEKRDGLTFMRLKKRKLLAA